MQVCWAKNPHSPLRYQSGEKRRVWGTSAMHRSHDQWMAASCLQQKSWSQSETQQHPVDIGDQSGLGNSNIFTVRKNSQTLINIFTYSINICLFTINVTKCSHWRFTSESNFKSALIWFSSCTEIYKYKKIFSKFMRWKIIDNVIFISLHAYIQFHYNYTV